MKFTVIAVGKLKERFWTEACAEYFKRLQPYAKTEVREIADVIRAVRGASRARATRRVRRSAQSSTNWARTFMWRF